MKGKWAVLDVVWFLTDLLYAVRGPFVPREAVLFALTHRTGVLVPAATAPLCMDSPCEGRLQQVQLPFLPYPVKAPTGFSSSCSPRANAIRSLLCPFCPARVLPGSW